VLSLRLIDKGKEDDDIFRAREREAKMSRKAAKTSLSGGIKEEGASVETIKAELEAESKAKDQIEMSNVELERLIDSFIMMRVLYCRRQLGAFARWRPA